MMIMMTMMMMTMKKRKKAHEKRGGGQEEVSHPEKLETWKNLSNRSERIKKMERENKLHFPHTILLLCCIITKKYLDNDHQVL